MRYNNKRQQCFRDRVFNLRERRAWKQVEQRVGHFIEEQLIEALDQNKNPNLELPAWYVSSRLATPEEDHRGIDVVVQTKDVGCFFLQVKSSLTFVAKFLLGKTRTRIAIVVIRPNDSVETIRNKFFKAARMEREWLKKRRAGERPPDERTVVR